MTVLFNAKQASQIRKQMDSFKSKLSRGPSTLKRTFRDTPIHTLSKNTREIMDGAAQAAIDGCNFIVRVTNKWFQLRNPLCFQSIHFPPPHIPRTSVNPPIATGVYVLVSRGWAYYESFTAANIGTPQGFMRSRQQWKYTYRNGEFPWQDAPNYAFYQGKFSVSREGAAWSEYENASPNRGYPYIEDSWTIGEVSYSFTTFEEGVRSISSRSEGNVNKKIPNLPAPTVLIAGLTYEQVMEMVGEDGTKLNRNYREVYGTPGNGRNYVINEGYQRWEAYEVGAYYGLPQMMIGDDMSNATDRQLLQLLVKRVGNLPANVPDLFTKQKPQTIKIESLAELALWQTQQLDALIGNYPIEIEIQDTDLVKKGNQSKKITLPNNAEAIAEMLGLIIAIKKESAAILVATMKALTEAGMTKQVSLKGLDVSLANAEYLGYKLDQISRKVPMSFTPGADGLSESLKSKEVEVISYENKSDHDLQGFIQEMKTFSARWNAQNWRQLGSDLVGSLKQNLLGGVKDIKTEVESDKDGDFSTFTNEIEQGFIGTTGITDKTNPWGAPYTERPKIRPIGENVGKDSEPG